MADLLVGARLVRNRAGYKTDVTSKLIGPPSITRMDRLGSASASLAATTHPAVPPTSSQSLLSRSWFRIYDTSSDNHVKLLNIIWERLVYRHCDNATTLEGSVTRILRMETERGTWLRWDLVPVINNIRR